MNCLASAYGEPLLNFFVGVDLYFLEGEKDSRGNLKLNNSHTVRR